jgi:hypothetical protein
MLAVPSLVPGSARPGPRARVTFAPHRDPDPGLLRPAPRGYRPDRRRVRRGCGPVGADRRASVLSTRASRPRPRAAALAPGGRGAAGSTRGEVVREVARATLALASLVAWAALLALLD